MNTLTRVAIVAGEASGDILGAGLIKVLKRRHPDCVFEGIGGQRMLAEGFISHYPLDRLAVMGLVEPLKRLPELLGIRRDLRRRYSKNPPDLFIGIDAPDFNLSLEGALKKQGIKTVHYVSPSVWAWRQGRVKGIAKSVDLMLTLFPFEASFYREHDIKVTCVGHPLADELPLVCRQAEAREKLNLDPKGLYIALLPGSRKSEVSKLCATFLQSAELCHKAEQTLKFLIPAANQLRYDDIKQELQNFNGLPTSLYLGRSHEVMAASDLVVMASGTTTLEAMLLKKPMVIAYRMAGLSFWILKRLVKSKYIGLPNLLANRSLVPELIQDEATPENISRACVELLHAEDKVNHLKEAFTEIHHDLRKDADQAAADAIEALFRGVHAAE